MILQVIKLRAENGGAGKNPVDFWNGIFDMFSEVSH